MPRKHQVPTPFQRYLAGLGDEKATALLGGTVLRRTVKSWRLGYRRPWPDQARVIVACMPVTFEDIYGASTEERAVALEKAALILRDQPAASQRGARG